MLEILPVLNSVGHKLRAPAEDAGNHANDKPRRTGAKKPAKKLLSVGEMVLILSVISIGEYTDSFGLQCQLISTELLTRRYI